MGYDTAKHRLAQGTQWQNELPCYFDSLKVLESLCLDVAIHMDTFLLDTHESSARQAVFPLTTILNTVTEQVFPANFEQLGEFLIQLNKLEGSKWNNSLMHMFKISFPFKCKHSYTHKCSFALFFLFNNNGN